MWIIGCDTGAIGCACVNELGLDECERRPQRSVSPRLITAKTTDAVRRFLNPAYVNKIITQMEAEAGVPITRPAETIQIVSAQLRFSDEQQDAVLNHFIRGADLTAGGVMHAVTSVAQTLTDADTAHEMESRALQVLHIAARA
jgi:hypothetical protein